ncbi:7964_t:CDS:2, partial [Acaulospora colombiana]
SMLQRVASRETTYANDATVTGSGWRSSAKLVYYRLFSFLYTSCLLTSPPVHLAVNSSWTEAHVEALLETQPALLTSAPTGLHSILYLLSSPFSLATILLGLNTPKPKRINEPPSTQSMEEGSTPSIAHKDHAKQIEALSILFKTHPELIGADERLSPSSRISNLLPESPEEGLGQSGWLDVGSSSEPVKRKTEKEGVSLVLLGSARHQEDLTRVEELKQLAAKLGVQ